MFTTLGIFILHERIELLYDIQAMPDLFKKAVYEGWYNLRLKILGHNL